jgi:hypothetical protein
MLIISASVYSEWYRCSRVAHGDKSNQRLSPMLGAKDLRTARISEDLYQFCDTLASMIHKGAFNFLRGYGQSMANPDDDGGRAYRERDAIRTTPMPVILVATTCRLLKRQKQHRNASA